MKNSYFFLRNLSIVACLASVPLSAISQKKETPKLVVGIVVDQMRNEFLDRYWDKFSDGGFKRLIGEGFTCRNTHYNYVPTYTGPGHASVYTGTTPAVHGVIGNYWYEKKEGGSVYCVSDSSVTAVGNDVPAGQRSPHLMLATTFTDELRINSVMRSKVIGISIKDRSAIFPAGHRPNGAYWYDSSSGKFISSTYYGPELPKWVQKFNEKKWAENYLSKPWETLLPIETYTESQADDNPYEGLIPGEKSPVFPHDLPALTKQSGFGLVSSTPFGNTMIMDMGLAAIEAENLGADDFPDVLALSFSANDMIGHKYGPRSIEVEDAFLRLDRDVERLLNYLDEKVGKGEYLIFLTADHGANEVPAYLKKEGIPVDYFDRDRFEKQLNAKLKKEYGEGDWVKKVSNEQVFLNEELLLSKKMSLPQFSRRVAHLCTQYPGISKAVAAADLQKGDPSMNKDHLLERGFYPPRSGNVSLMLSPGWMDYILTGTSHGSGYNYDTHVPLLWFGKNIPQGVSHAYTPITAIAPTVSFLLNIPLPNGSDLQPILPILDATK